MALIREKIKIKLKSLISSKFFWINFLVAATVLGLLTYRIVSKPKARLVDNYFLSDITKVCLNDNCLVKKGDNWWFENSEVNQPAANDQVNNFVSKLESLKLIKLVSQNRDKMTEFGFDSLKVSINAGDRILDVGRINDTYDGTYVKTEDSDNIYLAEVVLNKANLVESDFWINKIITNWPTAQITEIKATNGDKEIDVGTKDQIFVEKLAHLTAISYLADFDKSKATGVKITAKTEKENWSVIIGQIDKKYYATSDEVNYYEISKDDYFALKNKIR